MVSQSYDVTGAQSRASNRTFKSRFTHNSRNAQLDHEVERVNEMKEPSERSIDTATIMIPSSLKNKITTTASQLPSHQRGTEIYMRKGAKSKMRRMRKELLNRSINMSPMLSHKKAPKAKPGNPHAVSIDIGPIQDQNKSHSNNFNT